MVKKKEKKTKGTELIAPTKMEESQTATMAPPP